MTTSAVPLLLLLIVAVRASAGGAASSISSTWKARSYERFAGLSLDELRSKFLGVLEPAPTSRATTSEEGVLGRSDGAAAGHPERAAAEYPDALDWRAKLPSCIGAVQDQGQCGSCWAVSVAESVSVGGGSEKAGAADVPRDGSRSSL